MPEHPTNPKYNIRQYIDLAAFLKEDYPGDVGLALTPFQLEESKRRVAERLADRLAADSPAFDREKFLKACGVEPGRA
ncbi:unnamed protein product [marine sediment metagenome]|uniref:Uncharacterized protein n=1 Tax=marine sediment metagenome TaxID=412755 RepID=X0TTB8_9ZZZZ